MPRLALGKVAVAPFLEHRQRYRADQEHGQEQGLAVAGLGRARQLHDDGLAAAIPLTAGDREQADHEHCADPERDHAAELNPGRAGAT